LALLEGTASGRSAIWGHVKAIPMPGSSWLCPHLAASIRSGACRCRRSPSSSRAIAAAGALQAVAPVCLLNELRPLNAVRSVRRVLPRHLDHDAMARVPSDGHVRWGRVGRARLSRSVSPTAHTHRTTTKYKGRFTSHLLTVPCRAGTSSAHALPAGAARRLCVDCPARCFPSQPNPHTGSEPTFCLLLKAQERTWVHRVLPPARPGCPLLF
jgi:hypothetical protein